MRLLRKPDVIKREQEWNGNETIREWGQVVECKLKVINQLDNEISFKDIDGKTWGMKIWDVCISLKLLLDNSFKIEDGYIHGIFRILSHNKQLLLEPYKGNFLYNNEKNQFELVTNWNNLNIRQRKKEKDLQDVNT